MATEKKEVAVKQEENTAIANIEIDVFADAGKGNEEVAADDKIIPFLKIAQALSPQLKKAKPEYIEGLEEGDFFNSATNQKYSGQDGVVVIPCHYQVRYTEWSPREKGGGLVRDYGNDASIVDRSTPKETGGWITPDGNDLVKSGTHFLLVVEEDGSVSPCVLSLSGTQWKRSRSWCSMIDNIRLTHPQTGEKVKPPRWYMTYTLTTIPDGNDKGDWMSLKIEPNKPTLELENGSFLYMEAKSLYEDIRKGIVKADEEVSEQDANDSHATTIDVEID